MVPASRNDLVNLHYCNIWIILSTHPCINSGVARTDKASFLHSFNSSFLRSSIPLFLDCPFLFEFSQNQTPTITQVIILMCPESTTVSINIAHNFKPHTNRSFFLYKLLACYNQTRVLYRTPHQVLSTLRATYLAHMR